MASRRYQNKYCYKLDIKNDLITPLSQSDKRKLMNI